MSVRNEDQVAVDESVLQLAVLPHISVVLDIVHLDQESMTIPVSGSTMKVLSPMSPLSGS